MLQLYSNCFSQGKFYSDLECSISVTDEDLDWLLIASVVACFSGQNTDFALYP